MALQEIHQNLVDRVAQGQAFALAVVLRTEGSTPCKAGTKAILDAQGSIRGTVGGGQVEAETQRRGVEAIRAGQPVVFDFDLHGEAAAAQDPICGGKMRLLVDPTAYRHATAWAAAVDALRRRQRGVLVTTLTGGQAPEREGRPPSLTAPAASSRLQQGLKQIVEVRFLGEQEITPGAGFPGREAMLSTLQKEQPKWFGREPAAAHEAMEVLVEPLLPRPQLLIVGGGHVGQAVASQAGLVGFDIVVIDDRPEFAAPQLFPEGATVRCGPARRELNGFSFGLDTFVVIVTRGHRQDAEALEICLDKPVAYLGMIGSRRKVSLMREEFVASGKATAAAFDRVHAPIGLDLGAVTVPEIAVSIVAQLIAVRRRGRAFPSPEARIP